MAETPRTTLTDGTQVYPEHRNIIAEGDRAGHDAVGAGKCLSNANGDPFEHLQDVPSLGKLDDVDAFNRCLDRLGGRALKPTSKTHEAPPVLFGENSTLIVPGFGGVGSGCSEMLYWIVGWRPAVRVARIHSIEVSTMRVRRRSSRRA